MPRLINPVGWFLSSIRQDDLCNPLVSLENSKGHFFHVQPLNEGLVRVVHTLPYSIDQPRLRNHQRCFDEGVDGFHWEKRRKNWNVDYHEGDKDLIITDLSETRHQRGKGKLQIHVDFSHSIVITWSFSTSDSSSISFLKDFKNAYTYDARSQRVYHQVCREQSYMPFSEHNLSANENDVPQGGRFEFIYGLGETKGCMMKDGKRYMMDARDSLAADPQDTDPLYKWCPFYLHYNSETRIWYGLYYNTLSPSIFDFSGEHDFATGEFRSFSAESGPLDYYLLLGESRDSAAPNAVANIISQFARLVTPYSTGLAGDSEFDGWQASPTLPHLSQFGYLASSLALSERHDAQAAVIDYVREGREKGFPIDSMHLSSGYAVDSMTGNRNYFTWDPLKYPDPEALGRILEKEMSCKVIINVKPWLLETHPAYTEAAIRGAFVRAAPDARPELGSQEEPADADRCGRYLSEPARTMHWSKGMGETDKGSYFDFTSRAGCEQWYELMQTGVFDKAITGLWIDNNEFSSLIDDEEEIKGEIDLWRIPDSIGESASVKSEEVSRRMGWGRRATSIGSVGRAVLTMGMARATFEELHSHLDDQRPVIVTRSTVPGIQAFAHASWSGDNSTSWLSLKWSTKMTLSVGLSFGVGLYGHDIGGFAGPNSPSSELLIRWCQQSIWHTRFTIHSWKKVSTTPWMYDDKRDTNILKEIIHYRYRLIPMLYSLYVTHYHCKGWPVLKPMLWFHSKDWKCLTLDEQFIVGSHVLVAPVCTYQQRQQKVYLPHQVDGDDCDDACWYEFATKRWHRPSKQGNDMIVDAPLDCIPTFVRDGGIVILGPAIQNHVPLPQPKKIERKILLFPTPAKVLQERKGADATSSGSFNIITDDGISNKATRRGEFNELSVFFDADCDVVRLGVVTKSGGYKCKCDFTFSLPEGDDRKVIISERSIPNALTSAPKSHLYWDSSQEDESSIKVVCSVET